MEINPNLKQRWKKANFRFNRKFKNDPLKRKRGRGIYDAEKLS